MELKNPLYKNFGIHVVSCIFTVEKGEVKVLLIKRNNNPFYGYWALPGGGLYNNETLMDGAKRELEEKTGINNVNLSMYDIFDDINRSPLKRMIAVSFIGVIDNKKAKLFSESNKISTIEWFNINEVPNLAYDYNKILNSAIEELKEKIQTTDILKSLFPGEFTLPELQSVYETILNVKIDRRNFRKKMISLNLIVDTNKSINYKGKKPAKLYIFNEKCNFKRKSIF